MTHQRRLRAPQAHGAILAEPPLSEAKVLISANRRSLTVAFPEILGRTDLRPYARQTALAAAREYFQQCGEPVPPGPEESILMAGHQPDLFHPGVWVKNFALNGLAKAYQATPLNLIVDSDTAKSTNLRVPGVTESSNSKPSPLTGKPTQVAGGLGSGLGNLEPEQVKLLSVPFDRWTNEIPYEELRMKDRELFTSFPDRVAPILAAWKLDPILPAFWSEVLGTKSEQLGERFAGARRTFERRWGCHNLEIPVSRVCQTESFAWFACHLLAHLPRFHAVYNTCVLEYRRRHGIRSRSHPVPELASENGWLETPFWAWRPDYPRRRRRLMAGPGENGLELRLENENIGTLPLDCSLITHHSSLITQKAAAAWQELEHRGIKVRGRALLTTLYARLFLADLFIHGIGGAKYDELTDEIIRRFFGMEPPRYMVLSATVLLPLPTFPATAADRRWLGRELRDLHWNPQRHLTDDPGSLAAQKDEWLRRQPRDAEGRRGRFLTLRALTRQLNALLAQRERQLRQEAVACRRQLEANAILQRRDYPFCFYPEASLRPFLSQFLA